MIPLVRFRRFRRSRYLGFFAAVALIAPALSHAAPVPEELFFPGDPVVALRKTAIGGPNALAEAEANQGGQQAASALDGDLNSKHFIKTAKGEATGFVVKPSIGDSLATRFRFATANDMPGRDPWMVSIEGTNDDDALESGKAGFTLLYQGTAGLDQNPGRNSWGAWVDVPRGKPYKAYRVIVERPRDLAADGVQYSEMQLLGIARKSRRVDFSQPFKISFQQGSGPAPEGFLIDTGRDFGPQAGGAYGWAPDTQRSFYQRTNSDHEILSRGVRFSRDSKWQIELENGLYEVAVAVGSPDDSHERVPLRVQDVNYFGDLQTDKHVILKKTRTVEVTDGRLTLSLDETKLGKDWDEKKRSVCVPFIEVRRVAAPTEERMAVWSVDSDAATDRQFHGHVLDIRSTSKPESNLANTLWYDRPAKIWEEGAVLGNGRLGAVVYGNPTREIVQLNEDTLWNLSPGQPFANPDGKRHIDEARKMIFENKPEGEIWNYIYDHVFQRADGQYGPFMADYMNGGDLVLTSADGPFEKYHRALDLSDGIATTRYTLGGVDYTREAFTSAVSNVLVVRFTASKPGSISFTTEARDSYDAKISTEGNDTLLVDGEAPKKRGLDSAIRYQRRVKFLPEGGSVSANEGTITVSKANAVTMLVSIRTNYVNYKETSGDPVARTKQDIAQAAAKPYATLRDEHAADHRALYDRMSIDLGQATTLHLPTDERIRQFRQSNDPQMAALVFQFGRYLMMACSRPGTQAANLQGIWNPWYYGAWGGKYTININIQMNYWLPEPANLAECHEPLMDMLEGMADVGQATAQNYYGARGWVSHHNTDIWRNGHPIDGKAGMWQTSSAWFCDHIWERYQYGLDKEFLARMYPVMRDAANFYLDSLVVDPRSGHLVTAPSHSPENGGICAAPTMDVQLVSSLFNKTAAAAEVLGIDADLRKQWLDADKKMPPMKIGSWGQLQEWTHADLDDPKNKHRHVSHLYGLHPGDQITLRKTPDLFEAAKVSLIARGDEATGWSLGWKTNFWARLRDGDHAYEILKLLIKPAYNAENHRWGSGLYPNFFDAHPPFQIDGNFGAAAGILEMLVQSHEGEIELLPALPSAWPDGNVNGMRVRGGFEIDFKWAGGKPAALRVTSKGGTECKVRYGDKVVKFAMNPGDVRVLGPNLEARK